MNTSPTRLIELHREATTTCGQAACPDADLLLSAALGEQGAHLAEARKALAHCGTCAAAAQRALAIHRAMETLDAPRPASMPQRRGGWSLALAAGAGIMALAMFITNAPQSPGGIDLEQAVAGIENNNGDEGDGPLFRSSFNEQQHGADSIFSNSMM